MWEFPHPPPQKRGHPEKAAQVLRAAIDARQASAPSEETVGFVEGQSRLSYALGSAYEVMGAADEARKAWRVAVRGWERPDGVGIGFRPTRHHGNPMEKVEIAELTRGCRGTRPPRARST